MKKVFLFGLLFIFICGCFFACTLHQDFLQATTNGSWIFKEIKIIEKPEKDSPYSTVITGSDGKKIVIINFENPKKNESAKIEWSWTVPPKTLLPGNFFEMTQSFFVKEWKMDHFVSGSLNSFIQKGDSCVCEGGTDLGTVWMDYDFGNLTGTTKTGKKKGVIPNLGDLNTGTLKQIQILVNLKQNSSNYQWIYIYEWKDTQTNKKIEIELKVGNQIALVNSVRKNLDSPPYIDAGRTFVPFRFLGESFGATVSYTTSTKTKQIENIKYILGNRTIQLTINKKIAQINGKSILMDAAPVIKNKRVMIPVRFIAENLMAEVSWNPKTQTILIRKNQS